MKQLRPYQAAAMEALLKIFDRGKGLVVMASGLGKTILAIMFARLWIEVFGTRILYLINQTDPIRQAKNEFQNNLSDLKVQVIRLKRNRKLAHSAAVVFSTFQAMVNRLDEFDPEEFGLIIVDEAHRSAAPTYKKVIDHFRPQFLLGITATPNRSDGKDIREIFGKEVFEYSLLDALAEGKWLAAVDYRVMVDNVDIKKLQELLTNVEAGDRTITRRQIDTTVFLKERLEQVAQEVKTAQEGYKRTVIFCRSISHMLRIQQYFPEAEQYHSKLKRAVLKQRFNDFCDGKFQTILVINKFNEAVDIPDAELMVFLRGTQSETVWKQQVGRGLRRFGNKEKVVILDFVANVDRLVHLHHTREGVIAVRKRCEPITIETGWNINFSQETLDVLNLLHQLKRNFYPSWEEASEAAKKLGCKIQEDYEKKYKQDPKLPSHPQREYTSVWRQNGRWSGFLGSRVSTPKRKRTEVYQTWKEAAEAARRLGISNFGEYIRHYREDPKLPSAPHLTYKEDWAHNCKLDGFLGIRYTYEEAAVVVRKMSIKTSVEYKARKDEDPKLPSGPHQTYRLIWKQKGGWPGFLNTDATSPRPKTSLYPTWEEAAGAARKLGLKTPKDYKKGYRQDPKLSSNPNRGYADVWKQKGGWPGFLGQEPKRRERKKEVKE